MLALIRRRPEFRRVFLAHAVSRAGDAWNTVALLVVTFRLTGSGTGVAGWSRSRWSRCWCWGRSGD